MSIAERYREQGYVHARGVFSADEVEELRAALGWILDAVAVVAGRNPVDWVRRTRFRVEAAS